MRKILIMLVLILLGSVSWADTFPVDLENCIIRSGRVELTGWFNERRRYAGISRKHMAIDIPANHRAPVRAFKGGTVVEIDHEYLSRNNSKAAAYGNYVVIEDEHGNRWLYAHLNATNIKLNERVSEGSIIGWIGWTGLMRPAAHLHMEKRDKYNRKVIFTKQLGDSIRNKLPNPKAKYTFTLRK